MDIINHISDVLYRHDCVIIPDFGGIIASYKPASISPGNDQILPPSKSIAFNIQLKADDGLLTNNIARAENIGFKDAADKIKKFVNQCEQRLTTKEKLVFSDIGSFHYDVENNLQFTPYESANYLLNSYGLPRLKISLFIREHEAATLQRNITHTSPAVTLEHTKPGRTKKITTAVLASAAALFLGLIFFQWFKYDLNMNDIRVETSNLYNSIAALFISGDSSDAVKKPGKDSMDRYRIEDNNAELITFPGKDDYARDEPGKARSEKEPALDSGAEVPATESSGPIEVAVEEKESITESENKKEKITAPAAQMESNAIKKGHYIVVGSFKNKWNAQRFVKRLDKKGIAAIIIKSSKSFHRVGIWFPTKADAKLKLSNFRSSIIPGAWIYRHA